MSLIHLKDVNKTYQGAQPYYSHNSPFRQRLAEMDYPLFIHTIFPFFRNTWRNILSQVACIANSLHGHSS